MAVALALAVAATPGPVLAVEAPEVTASGAVLWDPADDRVLYDKAAEQPRPMASTTKIMTSLVALEAGTVDDEVTVSQTAAGLGQASVGLTDGQVVPMRSLLAGLIVRSGNDAAVAVAEHVAGDEETFVARMNTRARELELDATRFVNASGLTNDPGHHASPLDLARLADVAMSDPEFARWAGAETATVPGLPPMRSRNELLGAYEGATGVKTGYTALAGLSLVASATRDERTLYAVVLDSDDSFADASRLLDHGFDDFRRAQPLADGQLATVYRWAGEQTDVVSSDALAATVPVDAEARWRVILEPMDPADLPAGSVVGEATLLVDGRTQAATSLRTAEDVERPQPARPGQRVGAGVQDAVRAFARLAPIDRPA